MIGFFFAARAISMSDLNSAMRLSFKLALENGTDREGPETDCRSIGGDKGADVLPIGYGEA
jgi:hypothetical protein